MGSEVRWGLISTANINRRVIPAIRASARGELSAVASRERERAEAYAREWGIPRAFGSYQAMLDSGAVDAVYISLPNHLHAEWSVKALEAGVHVLCEKPFALTLAEVDRMIGTATTHGRVLAEAFMYRHHPQTKIVGEWVREGRLGQVTVARGAFNFATANRNNIRLVPEWGGGCLWDVGIYPMSFAQFVMEGPPLEVTAFQWLGDTGVDEVFVGQMRYAGDRFAQITSSFRTPIYTHFEVVGTAGRLTLNRPFVAMETDGELWFHPESGEPERLAVPTMYLYAGEVEDMHAAILDGAEPYLTLAETRDHVRTMLALYEAARSGRPVRLDDGHRA